MKYYICVELGGTNLRYGLIDQGLHMEQFNKIPTEGLAAAKDKVAYFIHLIQPLIAQVGKCNVICITMALSSLMDKERRIVYSSPMVKGFDNVPLGDQMEKQLCIPVIMEKDVNILLLYELSQLRNPVEGIAIGIFLGTGLGNAICIDGRVYRGFSGSAGELGHIPAVGVKEMCGCGKSGCIELLACGRILSELANKKYKCPVSQIFVRHANEDELKNIVNIFSVAIATEVGILDPAMVILGGGVLQMEGFPYEYLLNGILHNIRTPNPRDTINVVRASNDEHAGVFGAAIYAQQVI